MGDDSLQERYEMFLERRKSTLKIYSVYCPLNKRMRSIF